jgi:hypothetical protein
MHGYWSGFAGAASGVPGRAERQDALARLEGDAPAQRRVPSTKDRQAVLVSLTDAGRSLASDVRLASRRISRCCSSACHQQIAIR